MIKLYALAPCICRYAESSPSARMKKLQPTRCPARHVSLPGCQVAKMNNRITGRKTIIPSSRHLSETLYGRAGTA
jgi:hypothetical protein